MSRSEKIVIVDDDPEIRTLIEITLAAPHRTVISFSNGPESEKYLFSSNDVDLVVCGSQDLVDRLRSNERINTMPVILISDGDAGEGLIGGLARISVQHLRKPFEISVLRSLVTRALAPQTQPDDERDALTGLNSRRQFERDLTAALRKAENGGAPVAVTLGDLDGFAAINNRFGRTEGNDILRRVAAIVAQHLRATDSAARFGGDAFATLHPACDAAGATAIADRILGAVAADPLCIGVRMSLGIAVVAKATGVETARVLSTADEALRVAKDQGGAGMSLRAI